MSVEDVREITFASLCDEEPGRSVDVWWLGFHCAYGGDQCPMLDAGLREVGMDPSRFSASYQTYKTFNWVRDHVTKLRRCGSRRAS